jgi:hypothetical protein
MYSNVL